MKMKLEKGDPCFVRLHGGEVVKANYIEPSVCIQKSHRVRIVGAGYSPIFSYHLTVHDKPLRYDTARFVYPVSEMKRQMGLQ